MPITVAPARLANCALSRPTPPVTPLTSTVSSGPGFTAAHARSAVLPTSPSPPAVSQSSPDRFRRNAGGARQHEIRLASGRPAQNLVAERQRL